MASTTDLLAHDVRGDLSAGTPLLLFGSPMEAAEFATLVSFFPDRPVVTLDPRGAGRNPAGTGPLTPEEHAEDLYRLITALDAGPVDCFGTSGGAVNLLRLAELHPEVLGAVVAHEPPTVVGLPDAEHVLSALEDIVATYHRSGDGPAMAKFIALVLHDGEVDRSYLARPAPDPTAFGLSAEDDGSRTNPLIRNMPACNRYAPDVAALGALGERLVVAVGTGSGDTLAARGGRAVAAAVGVPVAQFPSHHGGFVAGQPGADPEGIALSLRAHVERTTTG
ncbi:alpha/beta fold hydrolase [Nocardioides anomalus]|nr:alpha/beta hydrolase [Nocardioides anomalus]